MKQCISFYILAIVVFLGVSATVFATDPIEEWDFTSIGAADMLVITHDSLRTPDWDRTMVDVWESVLLDQKQNQGIHVAILDITDGVSASDIRQLIDDSCGSFLKYIYIIGDADRQELDPSNPLWPESDEDSNRFVPFYGEDVDPGVLGYDHYPLENDLAYIDGISGLSNVSIGRLPAESRDEILHYLNKCGTYLNLSNPVWAKKQLMAFDNRNHPWVTESGNVFHWWASVLTEEAPGAWITDTLFSSNHSPQSARDAAFADAINDSFGLVFSLGVASHTNNLSYFQWGTSDFQEFDNAGVLPLLMGINCSVGAIQRPDSYLYSEDHRDVDSIFWRYNVVERLLFLEDAGIIGAIAPTQWTICDADRYIAKKALDFITDDNIRTFGSLWRRMVSLRDTAGSATLFSVGDWHYENLVLLGDPSLRYPLDIQPRGRWTLDNSPVIITDSLHVVNGDSLIIEAGVQVLFDAGAALVVDAGAKLIVDGTQGDTVLFDAKDSSETWHGIFVNGGQCDIAYAKVLNVSTYSFYAEAPAGSNTPVKINHSYFDGSQIPSGGIVLRMWDSPSLTQQVSNTVVENMTAGAGMYLYNCNIDFDSVTLRNCGYVNSYIKKVTGNFRNCTFEGRASYYGIQTNTATCSPNFMCCEFKDMCPTSGSFMGTIFCASSTAPTFGGIGYDYGVANVFDDSSSYLMVIYGSATPVFNSGSPNRPVVGGHNDWIQRKSSGKYIEWRYPPASPSQYNVQKQYWNPTPCTTLFTPASRFDFTGYKATAYGLCGGLGDDTGGGTLIMAPITDRKETKRSNGGLDESSTNNGDSLLLAIYWESIGAYTEAQRVCRQIAETATNTEVRWLAATHCVTTDVMLGSSSTWIPGLIGDLRDAENSYAARLLAGRIMSSYRLNRAEYAAAIDTCMNLLNSGLSFDDSIFVAIDLVGIQMAAGLRSLSEGSLDNAGAMPIPSRLKVTSDTQGLRLEADLMRLLGTQHSKTQSVAVPTEFRLYQNYPNPFNPNTEIKFDLPEAVKVQVKIFNTLGQEVATLVDGMHPAGSHSIIWDSKNASGVQVASGVYVYQIKAGNFVDSKKMVLIR